MVLNLNSIHPVGYMPLLPSLREMHLHGFYLISPGLIHLILRQSSIHFFFKRFPASDLNLIAFHQLRSHSHLLTLRRLCLSSFRSPGTSSKPSSPGAIQPTATLTQLISKRSLLFSSRENSSMSSMPPSLHPCFLPQRSEESFIPY